MIKKFLLVLLLGLLISNFIPASAQSTPVKPVYIVQKGDTLLQIAARFGISVDDLISENNISDPNAISIGTPLTIPGYDGIQGTLVPETVTLGQSFRSLVLSNQVPEDLFVRLNRITSPSEIYAGSPLIVPQADQAQGLIPGDMLSQDESLLELSVKLKENPWSMTMNNKLQGLWDALPSEMVFVKGSDSNQESSAISPQISSVAISPLPLIQGETTEIKVVSNEPLQLTGSLTGQRLNFYSEKPNEYIAFHGIDRMSEPGIFPINLEGKTFGGNSFSFEQGVLLGPRPRLEDPRLPVDPVTTDPTITGPENDLVNNIVTQSSPDRLWEGAFRAPVDVPKGYSLDPDCITDRFGNLRAYNDGPFDFYHSGLDLSACGNNLNIYAPAKGKVVFAGPLTVRGNYTIIDHGWGIFSGYGHQAEIKVKVGDMVEPGQLIGLIGKTGRVTGPHLHWDIYVNGLQVDPLDWMLNTYP
jgi:murein DD-endopeptidase MepM/ murein hydrolase activator NlpD